jgi:hypothetical protein
MARESTSRDLGNCRWLNLTAAPLRLVRGAAAAGESRWELALRGQVWLVRQLPLEAADARRTAQAQRAFEAG